LLQHFALETSSTITHNEAARAAWCAAVPQLSAKHMFVLQGTMAISALHISKFAETEREKKHFRVIATYQMSTGLIRYRETVAKVTEENAESLLAFSVTATAWVLLTTADDFNDLLRPITANEPKLNRRATIESLVAYTSKILRTLRGVLVIIVPCWNLIANGIFANVAKRDWWPYPIPTSPDAIEVDKRLANLQSMWMRPDCPYEYSLDLTVTDDAKRTRYGELIDWTSVLAWPISLPLAFVELVEVQSPEAWVLLAHYAMLPAKVEHVFWIEDFGPNLITAAALVLGENMRTWIQWPAGVIGIDLDVVFSAHTQT
ncbi:hypothetical protein BU23DRAFT_444973, partial [Bimuria novae-zelandiae CBS 107.79]